MTQTSWKGDTLTVDALIDTYYHFAEQYGKYPVRVIRDMPFVPDDACYVVDATRSIVVGRNVYRYLEEYSKGITREAEDVWSVRTLCGMAIEEFSPERPGHSATFLILAGGSSFLMGHNRRIYLDG